MLSESPFNPISFCYKHLSFSFSHFLSLPDIPTSGGNTNFKWPNDKKFIHNVELT